MPVIDVHTHMFTHKWLALVKLESAPYNTKIWPDGQEEVFRGDTPAVIPQKGHFDYELRIKHMDSACIDISIVSGGTIFRLRQLLLLAALAAALVHAAPSAAQTIIDEWQSVKAPPAPALKAVTLDPKSTAILVMDFVKQTCNNEKRPRCVASIPKIEKLQAAARAQGVLLISTTVPPVPIADTLPAVAPKGDEPVVVALVDKFMLGNKDTGLEKMLKDKGITTVVTVGTAANGAVLYTSSTAALRGFNVVVPVDGMSGDNAYVEQSVAYILTSAPGGIAAKITLTSADMIKFAN